MISPHRSNKHLKLNTNSFYTLKNHQMWVIRFYHYKTSIPWMTYNLKYFIIYLDFIPIKDISNTVCLIKEWFCFAHVHWAMNQWQATCDEDWGVLGMVVCENMQEYGTLFWDTDGSVLLIIHCLQQNHLRIYILCVYKKINIYPNLYIIISSIGLW